jgi:3'(2'), 5'-bisphosphate nucleotidase
MKLEAFEAKIACSVTEFALEAGKAIMDVYQSGFSVELKNDRSPLTKADKLLHEIVAGYLKRIPLSPL